MPQGAFYVFAEASKFTDDSYKFAFELLDSRHELVEISHRAWVVEG